jgi:tetraacyldisaccharide 4'-kinase
VPVVVGENRLEAGRVAVERCGASVVVLDDGFQHRTVAKDLEVLVVNGRAPWGNGRLFPRGTLREPLGALARAHLVVVANPGASSDVEAVAAALKRYHARAPIVTAAYRVGEAQEMRSGHRTGAAALAGRRLLAFCGLGWPRGFAETLERLGVELAGLVEFPDHYWFAAPDLYELDRHAQTVRAEGLITTEKDWVRLRELHLPPTPLWVLPARLHIESGHEAWAQALGRLVAPSSACR